MKAHNGHRKPVNPKLPAPYNAMTAEELERETARFDHEIPDSQIKPLTPAMRAVESKARRPGRPRIGKGAEKINITIERGLLKDADRMARQQGVSRSQIIACGLLAILRRKAG